MSVSAAIIHYPCTDLHWSKDACHLVNAPVASRPSKLKLTSSRKAIANDHKHGHPSAAHCPLLWLSRQLLDTSQVNRAELITIPLANNNKENAFHLQQTAIDYLSVDRKAFKDIFNQLWLVWCSQTSIIIQSGPQHLYSTHQSKQHVSRRA